MVGYKVGARVGVNDGSTLGDKVGLDGAMVGYKVGVRVGVNEGSTLGD